MFDWKKDLISKLPKGKGSVKKFGRSNDEKFNTIMKSVGADKNTTSVMDNASRFSSVQIRTRKNPSSQKIGYGAEEWDKRFNQLAETRKKLEPKKPELSVMDRIKHSLGINLSKEKEKMLAGKTNAKPTTERNGVLGTLDSTLGRIGNTANEMAFGKVFNDAQNANYKKLAEDKLKNHPNDKHAIQSLQMLNAVSRPAKNTTEKVSDFIGKTAGVMAPYTIGGAYGAADKGLQAISKLKPVAERLSKPLMKDLVRGLGAGAIAGSERAAMHKGASNEKVSAKDIALESALAGGGDAAVGALLRNLNLKGHLNTALHESGTKKFNAEDFQQALHDTFGQKGDFSNVVADVPKTMPKPFEPKYQNLKLPVKNPNEIEQLLKDYPTKPKKSLNEIEQLLQESSIKNQSKPIVDKTEFKKTAEAIDNFFTGSDKGAFEKPIMDALKKYGYVEYKNPLAVEAFKKRYPNWNEIKQTDGSSRFYPKDQPNGSFTLDNPHPDIAKMARHFAFNWGLNGGKHFQGNSEYVKLSKEFTDSLNKIPNFGQPPKDVLNEIANKYHNLRGYIDNHLNDKVDFGTVDKPRIMTLGEYLQGNAAYQNLEKIVPRDIKATPINKIEPIKPNSDTINTSDKINPITAPQDEHGYGLIDTQVKARQPKPNSFNYGSIPNLKVNQSPAEKLQEFINAIKKSDNPLSDTSNLPKQEERIILSQNKHPINLKRGLNRLYQNTFDTQHLIAGISNDVKVNASNARQTQGITDFIAEQGLVDKEGNKIGESLKELAQSVPLNKEEDFWRYVSHQHNIARSSEGKNVFSQFNAVDSEKEAQKLLAQHPEFKDAGKKVTNWINKFMDAWAGDTVGEDALKTWRQMYPDYIPVYREMDPLKKISFNGAKRGFVNHHNLVPKAKGAKADLSSNIKYPIGNITQLVNKTVKAQRNNEVGKSILDEVRKGGLDDLFEVVKTKPSFVDDINKVLKDEGIEGVMDKFTGQFDDVFKQAETGNNIVKVMENGKEVLLKVKDLDYLKALQSLSDGTGKSAAEQFESAARKVARPIKDLITSKNPLFGAFNLMRDTPTAFIQGAENNPIKFANRYMRALKEITTNSKGFQEFSAQGGMQSGFFKNDVIKTTSKLKNPKISPFEKMISKVELFNNVIESTPRYMEYLATLEKGGTKAQAIYNAAEVTTNFARNGKWGKLFDSFVLYLNPALQGMDKFVRQVKNKPLQTALKAGGVITAPQILTEYVNKDNPNYQALDQRLKDDFFLIPNTFGPLDNQGNVETFFRIPKAREYSVVFSVLANRIGELMQGESLKNASKGVIGSFDRNFSVPTRPIWSPFSDVGRNKDWKDAPINPMGMTLDNRSNYLKYDEKTSEIGKFLAKALNEQPIDGLKYSPKDIDYLIQSYTGIIGDILLPVATKNDSALGIPQKKFIADSVYSNQSINDFYENMQKLRTRATDKNILGNIPSKTKTKEEAQRNSLDKIGKMISDLNKNAKQTTDKEKQRNLRKAIDDLARKGNSMYNQYMK